MTGIIERDRHLGQGFTGKGDQANPISGSTADEAHRLPLGDLEPVGWREILGQHAAGDVDRDDDRDPLLLDLHLIATDARTRRSQAQARQSASIRSTGGSTTHQRRRPASAGKVTSLYRAAGARPRCRQPPPESAAPVEAGAAKGEPDSCGQRREPVTQLQRGARESQRIGRVVSPKRTSSSARRWRSTQPVASPDELWRARS